MTYMNVFSNPISNPEMTEPIEIDPKQNEVEVGDVFFTTSSETPEEVGMSSILLEKRGKTYLNSFCFGFRPSEKIDSYYLAYMLRSESTRAKIILLAQGISRYNISKNKVMEIAVSLPSLDEQKMIGQYFSQLDNLITLHQRQLFLHSTPDISLSVRLIHPFYTSSWEQRKAIDIADYSKGNGYSKGDLTDVGTPIILYGRLYTKYQFAISEVDTFAVPRNGAVYSQGNEVIVPASGETAEDIARASAVEKSGVLLGGDLNILKPFDFINPLFLALAISNGEPQKELAKKAQGKSVVHIHNTDIQEVTIAYPSNTEQDRIVSVFRQLDNLITLHQRKGKAAVSGCFLNCFSLEKSSAQSRTLELFGQISNQEIKYIIDGLSILGGKLRNFCVKLIILLSYTRINDIAKYHISRNTECVHNIN